MSSPEKAPGLSSTLAAIERVEVAPTFAYRFSAHTELYSDGRAHGNHRVTERRPARVPSRSTFFAFFRQQQAVVSLVMWRGFVPGEESGSLYEDKTGVLDGSCVLPCLYVLSYKRWEGRRWDRFSRIGVMTLERQGAFASKALISLAGISFLFLSPAHRAAAEPGSQEGDSSYVAIQTLWQEAEQLKASGQYEAAASRYEEILTQSPRWKERQKAAILAGICLENVGNRADAIELYDTAVALADEQMARGYKGPVMHWPQVALFCKSLACEQIGDIDGASRAIRRLRMEFPKSRYAMRAAAVKARLEGCNPDSVLAREKEALQISEQLSPLVKQHHDEAALTLADQILTRYPDTAAVIPALRTRALILWRNSRYDESRAAYSEILRRVAPVAPHSQLIRTAEYRLAWLDSCRLLKELIQRRRSGKAVPSQRWQEVRALCAEVIEKDPDPRERTQARAMIIESFVWQGHFEQAVAEADQFLAEYAGKRKLSRFKRQIAWVHLFAGYALQKQGHHEPALGHFRFIINLAESDVEVAAEELLLSHAYFRVWCSLRSTGAQESEIAKAASDLISRFPQSSLAAYVRRAGE